VSGSCNIANQSDGWCFASSQQGAAADAGCILEVQADVALRVQSFPLQSIEDGAVVWVNGVGFSRRDELHGLVLSTGSTVAWSATAPADGAGIFICEGTCVVVYEKRQEKQTMLLCACVESAFVHVRRPR